MGYCINNQTPAMLQVLADSRKRFDKKLALLVDKATVAQVLSQEDTDEHFLQDACSAFTTHWLMHTLKSLQQLLPELVNRDGEALTFCDTRFPFLPEQFDEIARRLDDAPDWERDSPDAHSWSWLMGPDTVLDRPRSCMTIQSLQNGQHPLSGTLELTPGGVKLTTNTMERAQRGQAMLETLLQRLIGPALNSLQTPGQFLEERDTCRHNTGHREPADSIGPEIAAEIIQHTLNQHDRQVLE
jgi:hypothetical protein